MRKCSVAESRRGRGTASGKVILLGEHAVVYGFPAIALPIPRQVTVELCFRSEPSGCVGYGTPPAPPEAATITLPDLLLHAGARLGVDPCDLEASVASDIPPGMGLGSSAALSVALLRALADLTGVHLGLANLNAHAYALECLFHGEPSGVDNTTVTYGTLLRFVRGASPEPLEAAAPLHLAVVLGKQPRRTRAVVARLNAQRQATPAAVDRAFAAIGELANHAVEALRSGDHALLGACMNENHELLGALGVSTDELDALVAEARRAGAWGAKLTGGGGGGAIVCLCPTNRPQLLQHFERKGVQAFAVDWTPSSRGAYERHVAELPTPDRNA